MDGVCGAGCLITGKWIRIRIRIGIWIGIGIVNGSVGRNDYQTTPD